jgi:ADP-ribose pyrophosphatase
VNLVAEDWASRRVIYRGRKIDLALQSLQLSNGTTEEREVVLHRGAVALLPMLPRDRIHLLHNHRYTVGETLIEVPAGTIDEGETPETTAHRELREETGYHAGSLERIADWFVSPGVMNERMYLFVCRDLREGPVDYQPDEALAPFPVSWDDALAMIEEGRIKDAKTILALILGNTHRRRS